MTTMMESEEETNVVTPAKTDDDVYFEESEETNVVTPAKADDYDDVYFDETNEVNSYDGDSNSCSDSNSDDSEKEMPDDSDDDGYDRYGGYNEYGERDSGYYYRDGRYERKTSPMMSPISPVTA
ncbi:hypothetical protein C1645_882268 [Glomus cerebriforme]|uniref:Uncharacterized protein n=1 Tax=Glomus cerebriforme TaxID=658196 RepID=A0A397SCZ3_9GLOM|nr:hypothetical protein C1645_882268 [Glomus cerebriforme]